MKIVLFLGTLFCAASLQAQTTAFTYQGRLNDKGAPASGTYDLQFGLWDASSGPTLLVSPQTNSAVAISNGVFTVTLDFGNQFPGADRWLEIGVRTNGGGTFTTLSPRQPLTPAPLAIFSLHADIANAVDASGVSGVLAPYQLPSSLITNGASGVNVSGTFAGNGTSLISLNAAQLTGFVPDAALSTNVALRAGGNIFSGSQRVVDYIATGPQALDQQDATGQFGPAQIPSPWQSFTAGASGLLTAVALEVNSPLGSGSSPGTIRIYAGEGTNGALLATQPVTWYELQSTFQSNSFSAPPLVQAGSQYTISFVAPEVSYYWVYTDQQNHYAGGQCDSNPAWDYIFKTYVTPVVGGQTVLMANPPGLSGYVGIGTNAPQAKLHVVGDILATGNITGNGGAFTNLNANNLVSGTVSDGRLSGNVALLNRPLQAFTGGTNSFSGSVGIGTTTPQSKLQVAGDVKLGPSGQYFAPAGEENLRIIRGSVSSTGTLLNGAGFICSRTSSATFQVNFNTAFSSNPSIVVSCGAAGATVGSQDVAAVTAASTTGFTVQIGVRNIGFFDEPFSFIAAGPR